jgi:hypothetical protein
MLRSKRASFSLARHQRSTRSVRVQDSVVLYYGNRCITLSMVQVYRNLQQRRGGVYHLPPSTSAAGSTPFFYGGIPLAG